jgi:ketosteroid isomerase-like protein
MSQENVEIVCRANAAFNSGDLNAALADYDPDVEWRDLLHAPDSQESVRGIAAVRAIIEQWFAAFDTFTADIEEYIDAGDMVVCVTRWRAEGKSSGAAVNQRQADICEIKHGRIVRVTLAYPDKAAALAAVGLSE